MSLRIEAYKEVKHTFGETDPGSPQGNEFFVFRDAENVVQMVEFLCPCGCKRACPIHVISMQEKQGDSQGVWKDHCWGYDEKSMTLYPSVRFLSGCKAHFFIKDGKTTFCADSGR